MDKQDQPWVPPYPTTPYIYPYDKTGNPPPTYPEIICSVETKEEDKQDLFCSSIPLKLTTDVACATVNEDWYKNGVQNDYN